MARYTVGSGSVRLKVDDPLRDIAIRAVREAAPETTQILEAEVDQLAEQAKASWPVGRERTGPAEAGRPHSRDLFDAEIVIDPGAGAVRGRVTNSAPYAYKITTSQHDVNGSPWQKLVVKPFKARTKPLVEALRKMTEGLLKG